ncbi:c-type cytochrome [Sphingobium herbicidovorans]|uniref:c-type cytochrome n=2 Tax=Sphingobium herbicidovorans TaxID=76947 RepID=UPI000ADB363D|nr:cytochrome c [Sphingobium herbicidovorans]
MKFRYLSAIAGFGIMASYAAYAASPAITDAVKSRQGSYKEIGGAFKSINDEIKSGAPDMNSVRPLARDIAARAALMPKFFPKGSGPESGLKTRAKSEIWKDNATFVKLQGEMITHARALNAAATSGNAAGLSAARTALGNTCKSCHDRFRAEI